MSNSDRILRGHSIQNRGGYTVILDHLGEVWHDCGLGFPSEAVGEIIRAYKAGHADGVKAGRIAKAQEIASALAEG